MGLWALPLLAAFLVAARGGAQPAAGAAQDVPDGKHSISGVVLDSIHRRPLAGADVVIAGTTKAAVTDSLGRFRFDSVDAGVHTIAFFHPFLDSMSVSTAPLTFSVPLDEGKGVLLAVPSIATLMRVICQTDSVRGRSLLVGRVTDPETGKPTTGASTFVTWTDFEVTKSKEIIRSPRTVQGGTDVTGMYRVCGLPDELDAVVYVIRDSSSTSRIAIRSDSSGLTIRNLMLEDPETAAGRRASLTGRVVTATGEPVASATVSVSGNARTTTTNSKGEYTLAGAPLGTRNLVVRRLGFVPATIPVDLTSSGTHRVDAVLHTYVLVMDPMYVIGQRDRALSRLGFTERRRRGLGDYRVRSDFERDNPQYLSDIVSRMRGVRLEFVDGRRVLRGVGEGSECVQLVVDGIPWASTLVGDLDDAVVPQHIAALEVYSGAAVPIEFEALSSRGCLTIVVWTRTKAKDFVK